MQIMSTDVSNIKFKCSKVENTRKSVLQSVLNKKTFFAIVSSSVLVHTKNIINNSSRGRNKIEGT